MNDQPWFPVAVSPPEGLSVTVDMRQFPVKFEHGSVVRLGVASAGECSNVSELVEVVLPVTTAGGGE
ncbi:MAG: hypothetical protein GX547_09445 [Phycisphaerae bacterium]|nr:hypothetical protein [Phycisphaerae bacterium]